MSLDKELEGVTNTEIESPDDLNTDLPDDATDQDQVPDKPNESDESEEGAVAQKKSERTLENVRGELLRKLDDQGRRIDQTLLEVLQLVKNGLTAQPPSKKPGSLDDIPLAELESQRGQVPEDQRANFDSYLVQRRIDEGIRAGLNKYQEEQKYQHERRSANQRAMQLFPQLSNRGSELYQRVNQKLSELPEEYRRYNPRIVLNLAEDMAEELGIQPRRISPRPRVTTAPSSTRSEKPSPAEKGTVDSVIDGDETYDKIMRRLGPAFKGRKVSKDKIMKRAKEYGEHLRIPKE